MRNFRKGDLVVMPESSEETTGCGVVVGPTRNDPDRVLVRWLDETRGTIDAEPKEWLVIVGSIEIEKFEKYFL